ncbi:CsbD family protein [Caulobacter vibrioides]|uniref:CsbD family protein n=1 Tax=Caulobacter vibrioides TaxID=155892 RepID=A0A2S1B7J8_CAUVI|nr:CsbD family protein [Caulobacter vibrioides]
MSTNRIEGAIDKGMGAAKEAVGKATGNEKLQAEGAVQKAKGDVQNKVGQVQDKIGDAIKR